MSLFVKTAFSPFTAVAKVIDDVLDVPHKDRWDTFVNNEPGINLKAHFSELTRGK